MIDGKGFFKAEYFDMIEANEDVPNVTPNEAAAIANAKLADYVLIPKKDWESAPVVKGYHDGNHIHYCNNTERTDLITTARLLDIQPIKKECVEHEPAIIVETRKLSFSADMHRLPLHTPIECVNCGVKLKAKWEAVKE